MRNAENPHNDGRRETKKDVHLVNGEIHEVKP